MKAISHLLFILTMALTMPLQSQVTFLLEAIPDYTPAAGPIFIAGDFNGWNPGDPANRLDKNQSGTWYITLPSRPSGTRIQYKFTRGSWSTVEKGVGGEEISNRSYIYSKPDTVLISIYNWADHSGETSTAASNVSRISDRFPVPQLGRTRRIWLYLPPDYAESGKYYPVLYMQDGQNVFDSYTSFAGEWNVDESLNELAAQGYEVPIVVAVDNDGKHRMDEYSPWKNSVYGGGEGELYTDFIASTLKPYIDSAYRTRTGPEYTGIMGSSMGGLISMYAAFSRPDVFSKAGIFSPSYWFSDSIWPFIRTAEKRHPMRIFQLAGTAEGESMVNDMLAMQDTLKDSGFLAGELKSRVVEGAGHNELFWRTEFKAAFLWLYPETSATGSKEIADHQLRIFPNPALDYICVDIPSVSRLVQVKIFSILGSAVANISHLPGSRIGTGNLAAGRYLLQVTDSKTSYHGWFMKE